MTRTEFSINNRTAFLAARLSTNPEIVIESRPDLSVRQPNHNRDPLPQAVTRTGILIDVAETIVSTVDEHLAELSARSGVPANTPSVSSSPISDPPAINAGIAGSIADDTSEASSAMLHAAAQRIWRMCLDTIRPQLTAQTMRTWFEPLEATALEGSEITLRAPSSFFCEWIGEHYQEILEQSLRDVLGPAARFRFDSVSEIESVNTKLEASAPELRIKKDENHTGPARAQASALRPLAETSTPNTHFSNSNYRSAAPSIQGSQMTQGAPSMQSSPTMRPASFGLPVNGKRPAIESNLNPRYTFDTFIRGESNKLAYAAAMAVANNPGGTRYNPLVIYGSVGLGKTHLIQAVGHASMLKFPSAKVLYTSSDRFTVEFVDSIQNDRINEFQALYRSIDVLIIDDVQFFAGKERTQDIFFHTFNALRELGKQIILTCDRPPKELKDLDDRLVNRLQWGLTTDIGAPDLETRIAILRHKAIADGIELSGEVIEFIAANVTSNIRELEGCLISLLAMSSLEGKEPTLDLAREVLRKVARRATPIISIEAIQRTVARRLGIEEELLRHKTRKQEVVLARQMAMYLCKEMTNHSLKSIGFHFGGRDHSTVIHAIQTIQEDMKLEPLLVKRIDELRKQIEMMQ